MELLWPMRVKEFRSLEPPSGLVGGRTEHLSFGFAASVSSYIFSTEGPSFHGDALVKSNRSVKLNPARYINLKRKVRALMLTYCLGTRCLLPLGPSIDALKSVPRIFFKENFIAPRNYTR